MENMSLQCVYMYVNLHKDYLAVDPIHFLMLFTQLYINVLCCGGFIECILVKFIFIQVIFITKKEKEHSILFWHYIFLCFPSDVLLEIVGGMEMILNKRQEV